MFLTHPQDSIFWGMVEESINWLFEGGVSNIFNNIGHGFITSFLTPPKFASKLANLPSREWEGWRNPSSYTTSLVTLREVAGSIIAKQNYY